MNTCAGCGREIHPMSINGADRRFRINISGQKPLLDIEVVLCPGCLEVVKAQADPRRWKKIGVEAEEEFSAALSAATRPHY